MPEPLTYDEIPSITAYAHLGVAKLGMDSSIPLNDFFLTGASNKISEYLAFGLPILMADTEVNRNFYTKYGFAVFADGTRPDSVAAAIKAAAIAGTYEQLRNCARKAGSDVFNYDTQFNKIVSIVEES